MAVKYGVFLFTIGFVIVFTKPGIPSSAIDDYRLAHELYQAGKYSQVVEKLKMTTRQFPEEFEVNFLLGAAYFKLERWSEALTPLERAASLDPTSFESHRLIGVAAMRKPRPDFLKAVQHLTKALQIKQSAQDYASDFELSYYLGYCFFAQKDYSRAIPYLLKAHLLKPNDEQTLYWLSWSQKYVSGCSEAQKFIEKAVALQPARKDVLILYGYCLLENRSFEKALQIGQQITTTFPQIKDGYFITGQANLLKEKPDLPKSVANFRQTITLAPEDAPAYFYAGQCYEALQQYDQARHHYEKATHMKPKKCSWHYKLGHIYELLAFKTNNFDFEKRALKVYQQVLSLCPQHEPTRKRIHFLRKKIQQRKDRNNVKQ
ncbi:tetratricopeptide repeat protein [candidate division CSSED10-310 bacterium]|uniref:Tetratricopeptide repeat protein n=1 Tax=candidate division CSSED10-310 bacterium TaxID=2855610 RepID=A0ABV6YRY6_UNCC1